MTSERYSEETVKMVSKRAVTNSCTKVRNLVAKKQILDDNYLDADATALIQDFLLSMYPEDYTFLKDSIYYDVKAHPIYHFKVFLKLSQLYEVLFFDQKTRGVQVVCSLSVVHNIHTLIHHN
jgi:hypothetical protein